MTRSCDFLLCGTWSRSRFVSATPRLCSSGTPLHPCYSCSVCTAAAPWSPWTKTLFPPADTGVL